MATKPHQCALALAIPLNRNDFLTGLSLDINKDFAKSLARKAQKAQKYLINSNLTQDDLWENYYNPTVKVASSVAEAVAEKGVKVIYNATLDNFQELVQRFQVVTLVAHWRSATFYPSDFIKPDQLIKVLEEPSTALVQKLVSALPENWRQNLQTVECNDNPTNTLSNILAEYFNDILKDRQRKLYPDITSNQGHRIASYDEDYHKYLNRLAIDDNFNGIIAPGNRIEFFDQFHPIEEVIAAIPEKYDGLLDFTVCHSVLIGNVLKRQRQCIVIVNKNPAPTKTRMVIYKGIIELLARLDLEYMDAAAMIRRANLQ